MASTPANRSTRDAAPIREFGFATKLEAIDAERVRRVEEQKKLERKKAGAAGVAAAMPTTLAMLLAEFMKQHAEEKLSPTTVEGYHKMIEYLAPELLAMNMTEITPMLAMNMTEITPLHLSLGPLGNGSAGDTPGTGTRRPPPDRPAHTGLRSRSWSSATSAFRSKWKCWATSGLKTTTDLISMACKIHEIVLLGYKRPQLGAGFSPTSYIPMA